MDLAKVLGRAFEEDSLLTQERYWNDEEATVVDGISSLVANYPPATGTYSRSEVRTFMEIAGFSQLAMRQRDFAEDIVGTETAVDMHAFPSLKATIYTVFHKFYVDTTRKPSRSDAFDIIISAATPYVEAIVTESHQAESLRKTKRLDDFIRDLRVYTLKDFRDSSPARAA